MMSLKGHGVESWSITFMRVFQDELCAPGFHMLKS